GATIFSRAAMMDLAFANRIGLDPALAGPASRLKPAARAAPLVQPLIRMERLPPDCTRLRQQHRKPKKVAAYRIGARSVMLSGGMRCRRPGPTPGRSAG